MVLLYINVGYTPKRSMKLIELGVRHFLVSDKNSLLFLLKLKDEYDLDIMCDNGVYTKGKYDLDLIKLAKSFGVKYIMPDVIEDTWNTIRLHVKYRELYDRRLAYIVLQGKNITDYLMCYYMLKKYFPSVRNIAIGGLLVKKIELRKKIVKKIRSIFNGNIHSLGYITDYANTCDISIRRFLEHQRRYKEKYGDVWKGIASFYHSINSGEYNPKLLDYM